MIRTFLVVQTFILLISGYAIYWQLVGRPWGRWSFPTLLMWQGISLVFAAIRFALYKDKPLPSFKPLLSDAQATRIQTLIDWRWKQIFLRNRIAKLCLGLAFALQIVSGILLFLGAPFPLAVLLAMASGILLACGPSFQLQEDMRAIWFERQVGSSHEEYVSVYQRICLRLALVFGLSALIIAFASRGFEAPIETLKLFAITALYPVLLPAVMFQIAPERPTLQIMTMTLIGLFLGTAIFAHWASVVIIPIAMTYAKQYQQNNFYRS
ncbi:MAG: hypothetical protein EOP10_29730 [Proteobacteria bacterium]|nr:MAG: hypothetical protein EOP10_29730 [Pseudomonadota bacterium]